MTDMEGRQISLQERRYNILGAISEAGKNINSLIVGLYTYDSGAPIYRAVVENLEEQTQLMATLTASLKDIDREMSEKTRGMSSKMRDLVMEGSIF